ncbi:MAG: prolipoprotein diacylglyceryl transferase [Oscillospiraceae bacterium]|nr:prolipoprotein diacylglyceryl transferase [Oscillospiraceae bacterium]
MVSTVSFPGLGLEFDLNRVALILFGRNVYWYGVIIGLGFLLAVLFCTRRAQSFGIVQEDIYDLLIAEVPLCLIGCRAYYVIFYLDRFRNADGSLDWGAMLRISDGGIAIYGAIITAAVVLAVFCKWKKVSFLAFADLGVQGLLIGQLVGRWGNFMNVEAYGSVTGALWRMCSPSIAQQLYSDGQITDTVYRSILNGELGVHPTFLYESLWNFVGLALIVLMSKKFYKFDGQLFAGYVFWYGLGRFWIEGLRTDSLYFFGLELFGQPVRTSQMVALLSAVAAGAVLVYFLWFRRGKHRPLYVERVKQQKEEEA